MPASNHPTQALWQRFRRRPRAMAALVMLCLLLASSLCAELIANDRPLIVATPQGLIFPSVQTIPETALGGTLETNADFTDPAVTELISRDGTWALWPLHRASPTGINLHQPMPSPAAPSATHPLGTDDRGRDVLAQLLYGTRTALLFGLSLASIGVVIGLLIGGLLGYFGGRADLLGQRLVEIWTALPELYLLIILTAFFEPSIWMLGIVLSIFSWIGLSDVMRAEMLRLRETDYVAAARGMGLSHGQILVRHLIPNSLAPLVTFFPFRVAAAIFALSSLDFLGLGLSGQGASLGALIAQGKDNLDAWWIGLPAVALLTTIMVLLVLVGEGLKEALRSS